MFIYQLFYKDGWIKRHLEWLSDWTVSTFDLLIEMPGRPLCFCSCSIFDAIDRGRSRTNSVKKLRSFSIGLAATTNVQLRRVCSKSSVQLQNWNSPIIDFLSIRIEKHVFTGRLHYRTRRQSLQFKCQAQYNKYFKQNKMGVFHKFVRMNTKNWIRLECYPMPPYSINCLRFPSMLPRRNLFFSFHGYILRLRTGNNRRGGVFKYQYASHRFICE